MTVFKIFKRSMVAIVMLKVGREKNTNFHSIIIDFCKMLYHAN